jgi:hypothetical protein
MLRGDEDGVEVSKERKTPKHDKGETYTHRESQHEHRELKDDKCEIHKCERLEFGEDEVHKQRELKDDKCEIHKRERLEFGEDKVHEQRELEDGKRGVYKCDRVHELQEGKDYEVQEPDNGTTYPTPSTTASAAVNPAPHARFNWATDINMSIGPIPTASDFHPTKPPSPLVNPIPTPHLLANPVTQLHPHNPFASCPSPPSPRQTVTWHRAHAQSLTHAPCRSYTVCVICLFSAQERKILGAASSADATYPATGQLSQTHRVVSGITTPAHIHLTNTIQTQIQNRFNILSHIHSTPSNFDLHAIGVYIQIYICAHISLSPLQNPQQYSPFTLNSHPHPIPVNIQIIQHPRGISPEKPKITKLIPTYTCKNSKNSPTPCCACGNIIPAYRPDWRSWRSMDTRGSRFRRRFSRRFQQWEHERSHSEGGEWSRAFGPPSGARGPVGSLPSISMSSHCL